MAAKDQDDNVRAGLLRLLEEHEAEKKELESARLKLDEGHKELEEARKERDQAVKRCTELEQELRRTSDESSAKIAGFEKQLTAQEEVQKKETARLRSLEQELAKRDETVNRLEGALKEGKERSAKQIAGLEEKLVAARKAQEESTGRVQALEKSLSERAATISSLEQQLGETRKQYGEKCAALEKDLGSTREAQKDAMAKVADLEKRLKSAEEAQVEWLEQSEREKKGFQERIGGLEAESKKRGEAMGAEIGGLKSALAEREDELAAQRKRAQAAEDLCAQLQAQSARELAEWESRVAELESALSGAQEALASAQESEGAKAEEIRRLSARAESLGEQLTQRTARYRELEAQLEDLRKQHSSLGEQHESARAELVRARQEQDGTVEELNCARNELEAERRAHTEAKELQAHTAELCTVLEIDLKSAQAASSEAAASVRALRVELDAKAAEVNIAGERIQGLEAQLASVQQEKSRLAGEVESLNRRAAEQEAGAVQIVAERDRAQEQLEETRRQAATLEKRLFDQAARLDLAQQELAETASRTELFEARRTQLESRIAELEETLRVAGEAETRLRAVVGEREGQAAAAEQRATEAEEAYQQWAEEVTLLRVEVNHYKRESESVRASLEQERTFRDQSLPQEAIIQECNTLRQSAAELQTRIESLTGELDSVKRQRASEQGAVQRATEQAERAAARIAELDKILSTAREQESQLRNELAEIKEKKLGEQGDTVALRAQLETLAAAKQNLESELAESRAQHKALAEQIDSGVQQVAELGRMEVRARQLESEVERLTASLKEQETARQAETGQLAAQLSALQVRVASADAERQSLQEQVTNLVALKERLDTECDQLRRRVPSSSDLERHKGEMTRLQQKLEEVERQHREAVQRHSAAVSGYMYELNQRTELLRQREAEFQKQADQVTSLKQACDDATSELKAVREERELLELRVKELESRAARPAPPAATPGAPARPAATSGRSAVALRKGAIDQRQVTLICVEEDQALAKVITSTAAPFHHIKVISLEEARAGKLGERNVLAINLLAKNLEPLGFLDGSQKIGNEGSYAFAYCAENGRGFALGMADFFFSPFSAEMAAPRLVEHAASLQKLLAVCEDVEAMNGLREILTKMRCSLSIAFDARQALDLIPMVKPDVALVDVALPRGDGFRVMSRLRTDKSVGPVPVSLLWTKPHSATEFRQQLVRVARDIPFKEEDLARHLTAVLSPGGALAAPPAVQQAG